VFRNYDNFRLATPPRFDDPPGECVVCPGCREVEFVEALSLSGLCRGCWLAMEIAANDPDDDSDDDDSDIDDDPDKTPLANPDKGS